MFVDIFLRTFLRVIAIFFNWISFEVAGISHILSTVNKMRNLDNKKTF